MTTPVADPSARPDRLPPPRRLLVQPRRLAVEPGADLRPLRAPGARPSQIVADANPTNPKPADAKPAAANVADAHAADAHAADDGIRRSGLFAYVVRDVPRSAWDARRGTRLRLAPAWPLWALLVPFPIWWALGLGTFIFPILALPMLVTLWRRRRSLRLPPLWGFWAAFLLWTLLSLVMFGQTPDGTHTGTLGGRLISTAIALIEYLSGTIALLFVGNLTERELPIDRVMRWLAFLFLVTVAGGLLGTYDASFQFTAPLEYLLPNSLTSDPYVAALVHPAAAQLQAIIGTTAAGRAAAPFGYTNFWANNYSLLLVWFVVSWGIRGTGWRRFTCIVVVAISIFPVVQSLNRGLWLGLIVSVIWIACRLFASGRVATLLAVLVVVGITGVVVVSTPLASTVTGRLKNQNSNSIRDYLTHYAIDGAVQSPVVGWGGTRKTNGSAQSIAIGKSPKCNKCGDFTIGSNGQLWAVLFGQGFVGLALFFGFFILPIWTYRRDRTDVGQAGVLVLVLVVFYSVFYNSVPAAFTISMISMALLWRSRDQHRVDAAAPADRLAPRPRRVPLPVGR